MGISTEFTNSENKDKSSALSHIQIVGVTSRICREHSKHPSRLLEECSRLLSKELGHACLIRYLTAEGRQLEALEAVDSICAEEGVLHTLREHAESHGTNLAGVQGLLWENESNVYSSDARRDDKGEGKFIVLPISAGERVFGAIFLGRKRSGTSYSSDDILCVREVGERIALALETQEDKFRLVADSMPQIVWVANPAGERVWVNKNFNSYSGAFQDEDYSRAWTRLVHPDDLANLNEVWKESVKFQRTFQHEYRMRGRDGIYRWFLGRAVPIRDALGRVTQWIGTSTEIEEQKQLLLRLRESRDQLDAILHGVTDGITVLDDRGRFIYANQLGAEMCGFRTVKQFLAASNEEIFQKFQIQRENGEKVSPEELPGFRALRGERNFKEVLVQTVSSRTGDARWMILSACPVLNEKGQVKFAVNIFRDFTARKRTEDAFRLLAEAGRVLTSTLDYKTTMQSIAQITVSQLADWCSVTIADHARGLPFHTVTAFREGIQNVALEKLERVLPERFNEPFALRVVRTGVSEIFPVVSEEVLRESALNDEHFEALRKAQINSAIIVPLRAHGKTYGALTMLTLKPSRRYRMEDLWVAEELGVRSALAIDNALLFQQAREAIVARDEFLSIASHELKTPLTPIKLRMQSLIRNAKKTPGESVPKELVFKVGNEIDAQVKRISILVEDLLDASRISSGRLTLNFEESDLREIFIESLSPFEEQLQRAGITLQMKLQESIPVRVDRLRIGQVISNLVANAIKYAPGAPLEIELKKENGKAKAIVRDYGPGIPQESKELIFSRYERAGEDSGKVSGLGLGLYISKQIMLAHQGDIWVQDAPNHGASFVFELSLSGINHANNEDSTLGSAESAEMDRLGEQRNDKH